MARSRQKLLGVISMRCGWTALPIVFLAAALAAGEAFGFAACRFSELSGMVAFATMVLASVAAGWGSRNWLYAVVFLTGIALAWHEESKRMSIESYAKTVPDGGGAPVFTVKVHSDAVCGNGRNGMRRMRFDTCIGNIPVRVVSSLPEGGNLPAAGEIWRCAGWLSLRKNAHSRYSLRTLWVAGDTPPVKADDAKCVSAKSVYRRISAVLAEKMREGLEWSPESAAFGNAMILGRREGVPYGKLAAFATAGTIHVFAISGLHVMLVAGMLKGLLKSAGLPRKAVSALVIPALAAYVMLIGSPASAVRAALMTSFYLGAPLFGRKPDLLAAWGISAIVVCVCAPAMVLDVGCILSFTVMLGIALWLRWSALFASPADVFLKLAARESKLGSRRGKTLMLRLHGVLSWLLGGLGISFAAWIAGTPVAAKVFGRFVFSGVLLNVAVVPLAGMAVSFGIIGMTAAFFLPYAGMLFKSLAALCIFMMASISEKASEIPGVSIDTLPWSWGDCVMWYAAWIGVFFILSRYLPLKEYIEIREWDNEDD